MHTESFWVEHVNGAIEIGWQNLPSATTHVLVGRSANQTGPWATLLQQNNPVITEPYFIRVIDQSLNNPYYYRLTASAGSQTVATYGPIFLDRLAQ